MQQEPQQSTKKNGSGKTENCKHKRPEVKEDKMAILEWIDIILYGADGVVIIVNKSLEILIPLGIAILGLWMFLKSDILANNEEKQKTIELIGLTLASSVLLKNSEGSPLTALFDRDKEPKDK